MYQSIIEDENRLFESIRVERVLMDEELWSTHRPMIQSVEVVDILCRGYSGRIVRKNLSKKKTSVVCF